jgi:hypothetical protein
MNERTHEPKHEPRNDSPEALQAAMAKEKSITAWISLDVEPMRAYTPREIAETVLVAADTIRHSLMRELAKNGIHVSRNQLREARTDDTPKALILWNMEKLPDAHPMRFTQEDVAMLRSWCWSRPADPGCGECPACLLAAKVAAVAPPAT